MVGSRKEEFRRESRVFESVVKQEVVAVEECPERRRTWTGAWGGDAFKTARKKVRVRVGTTQRWAQV